MLHHCCRSYLLVGRSPWNKVIVIIRFNIHKAFVWVYVMFSGLLLFILLEWFYFRTRATAGS